MTLILQLVVLLQIFITLFLITQFNMINKNIVDLAKVISLQNDMFKIIAEMIDSLANKIDELNDPKETDEYLGRMRREEIKINNQDANGTE